jgi:hypothetical protein
LAAQKPARIRFKSDANRTANGRFAAGNPGKPKGAKHRATLEVTPIKELASIHLLDPEYLAALKVRLKAGDAPHMEKFFAEHLWGKPKETIDLNITQTHIQAIIMMSDLELSAFLDALSTGRQDDALQLLPGSAA